MITAIACFLFGLIIGPRLHWLGLIFLSAATFLFSCAGGISRGDPLWFIAFSTTLNITALQAGYLGSIVIQFIRLRDQPNAAATIVPAE